MTKKLPKSHPFRSPEFLALVRAEAKKFEDDPTYKERMMDFWKSAAPGLHGKIVLKDDA